ncbi:MAG: DUF6051 family protein [Bacteroidales bacterium]|nr:DUF6051 family protein [Bacteroidales bacterium]
MFDLSSRQDELLNSFRLFGDYTLDESHVEVKTFLFKSREDFNVYSRDKNIKADALINENYSFYYPVFTPEGKTGFDSAILLLHGLNERSWDKYLSWAEYLVTETGRPVILFPIAYHINRAPVLWSSPRDMMKLVSERKKDIGENDRSITFVNVALSERLDKDPGRFYNSGRQTIIDITEIAREIHEGEHPLFLAGAKIDIMSYSIGAFLAEVLLIANPCNFFSNSKLFMFCGGAVFNFMDGASRSIMDKKSFEKLYSYYTNEWFKENITGNTTFPSYNNSADEHLSSLRSSSDSSAISGNDENGFEKNDIYDAFTTLIRADREEKSRKEFFRKNIKRICGISLMKDTVIPYSGVEACMGKDVADKTFEVMDFPYKYTHEKPFPTKNGIDGRLLTECFKKVFSRAAEFLAC